MAKEKRLGRIIMDILMAALCIYASFNFKFELIGYILMTLACINISYALSDL